MDISKTFWEITERKNWSSYPVCGIFALAVISNKDVEEVFSHHKKYFHKGDKWKGRTNWKNLLGNLTDFDIEYVEVDIDKRVALKSFPIQRDTPYLVRVGNHFVVVYNDKFIDQYGVWNKDHSRKIVSHAARVVL